MKKTLAIVICLSVLLQCMVHLGIIGYYELRKDYIARNLCENRDRPQLKCCGKCYLRKQLNKIDTDNGTPNNKTAKVEKDEVIYVVTEPLVITKPVLLSSGGVFHPVEKHLHDFLLPVSIFRPPGITC